MQTLQHEKAIRYLGIAVVVFSALALLGTVIGFIFMGVGHAALNAYGPDMLQQGYEYGRGHHGYDYYGDLSASDAMGLANFGMGLGYVVLAWELLTAVVSLIAGILAIRGAANHAKLGGVFGWGIAGAVAAFLGGRIITCVLLIIVAVLAYKDKNAPAYPAAGYGYGAPAPGYGQPVPPAGGYGYGAPAAAAAPVPAQPVQPAQPVDPQAQAYQAAYQQSYGAPVAAVAGTGAAAAAAVNAAEYGEAQRAAAAYDAGIAATAAAQPAAVVADGAAQAAAAVNAAESGEAARAAQEYAAGVASTEAADVAHLAADAAQAAEGDTVVVIEDAEEPKA